MRLWTIRAWKKDTRTGFIYASQAKFRSNAETIEEAFSAAYTAGFACLYKNSKGQVVAAAQMSVSMASQSLLSTITEEAT